MNFDIKKIKSDIWNYEISRSVIGWMVAELGSEIAVCIDKETAKELIELMDAQDKQLDEKILLERENAD